METPRQIKTKAYHIVKFSILMTAILIQSVCFDSSVLAQCYPYSYNYPYEIYCHYANSYPDRGQPLWGNHDWSANGIANDNRNWYFAAHNRNFIGDTKATDFALYRVPVAYDINNFNLNQPGVKKFQLRNNLSASDTLRRYGYGHVGDIDYCKHNGVGYIAAPMTGRGPPLIAFFRADDLSYIHYAILDTRQQESVGWCAFSGDNYLYTSHDDTDRILRYTINWNAILNKSSEFGIAFDTSFVLRRNNNPIVKIKHMQGGDFTPSGELLYISCGILSCLGKGESDPQDGIYVFETKNWNQVLRSSNSKMYPESVDIFDFKFNNNTCSADEPEGLTIWDVDHLKTKHHDKLRGHLHIILDNHNKYQIIRNIFESKWAYTNSFTAAASLAYKGITKVVSFFKRSKPQTSKVSIQHFGPYKYDSNIDGGAVTKQEKLTEQDKIDIALLENAFMYLQKGDTLGMVKYLVDNLDENGYPMQRIRGAPSPRPQPPYRPTELDTNREDHNQFSSTKHRTPGPCDVQREVFLDKSEAGKWKVVMQKFRREGKDCVPDGSPELIDWVKVPPEENTTTTSPNKNDYFFPEPILVTKDDVIEYRNPEVPYNYDVDYYSQWQKGRDIQGEFRLVVPSAYSKKVWIVMTNSPNNWPIEAKNISVSWFIKPADKALKKKWYDIIQRLARCAVNDPDLIVLHASDPNSLPSFIIAGNPDGKDYILCFGYSGKNSTDSNYIPVQLLAGVDASRQYVRSIRAHRSHLKSPFNL